MHGWGGGPDGACLPWLRSELEKQGLEVVAPQMPDTENPVIEKWVPYLSELVGAPDENTYFVGHSIGCQTILRYLQTVDRKIGGALFIAGWFVLENLDAEEKFIAQPWIEESIDFEKVGNVLEKSILLISDDDPFGGFEYNKKIFSEKLGTEVTVFHGAGHMEDLQLPAALQSVLEMTN